MIEGECTGNEQSMKFQNFQRGISCESVARDKFNRESGIRRLVFLACFTVCYALFPSIPTIRPKITNCSFASVGQCVCPKLSHLGNVHDIEIV